MPVQHELLGLADHPRRRDQRQPGIQIGKGVGLATVVEANGAPMIDQDQRGDGLSRSRFISGVSKGGAQRPPDRGAGRRFQPPDDRSGFDIAAIIGDIVSGMPWRRRIDPGTRHRLLRDGDRVETGPGTKNGRRSKQGKTEYDCCSHLERRTRCAVPFAWFILPAQPR